MPIKFDTLEYVKRLIEAGVPSEQAEAQVQALAGALSEATVGPADQLILKADLLARMDELKREIYVRMDELRYEIYAHIDVVAQELHARIDKVEADLKRLNTKMSWFFGGMLALLALQAVEIGALVYIIGRLP